jgi:hypothetical protein
VSDFVDLARVTRFVVRDERDPVTENKASDDGMDVRAMLQCVWVGVLHCVEQRGATGAERLHCRFRGHRPARPHAIRHVDAPLAAAKARNPRVVEGHGRRCVFGQRFAAARRNQVRHGPFDGSEMLEDFSDGPSVGGRPTVAVGSRDALDGGQQAPALEVNQFELRS